jgi:hypothetical protein
VPVPDDLDHPRDEFSTDEVDGQTGSAVAGGAALVPCAEPGCGGDATYRCAFPVGGGQQCHRPLCERHRIRQAVGQRALDFCAQHAVLARGPLTVPLPALTPERQRRLRWKRWQEGVYILVLLAVLGVCITMIIIILVYGIRALIGPV